MFLKNSENVVQIWNITGIFFQSNILTQNFAFGEVHGATYFQMGFGGQLHIVSGVLDMKY